MFLLAKWLLTSARPPWATKNTEPQRLHITLPFPVFFRKGNSRFSLSVGPAKVNKVKIFSGPCCTIKRVLTFVSGLQVSVLIDFISQNKIKILRKVKTCQNSLHQKFPYKNEQIYVFLNF